MSAINITNPGTNYIHGATVIYSRRWWRGAGATATVTTNHATTELLPESTVTNAGAGYVTPPTVTIVSTGLDTAAHTPLTPTELTPSLSRSGAQQVSPTDSVLGTLVNGLLEQRGPDST